MYKTRPLFLSDAEKTDLQKQIKTNKRAKLTAEFIEAMSAVTGILAGIHYFRAHNIDAATVPVTIAAGVFTMAAITEMVLRKNGRTAQASARLRQDSLDRTHWPYFQDDIKERVMRNVAASKALRRANDLPLGLA